LVVGVIGGKREIVRAAVWRDGLKTGVGRAE